MPQLYTKPPSYLTWIITTASVFPPFTLVHWQHSNQRGLADHVSKHALGSNSLMVWIFSQNKKEDVRVNWLQYRSPYWTYQGQLSWSAWLGRYPLPPSLYHVCPSNVAHSSQRRTIPDRREPFFGQVIKVTLLPRCNLQTSFQNEKRRPYNNIQYLALFTLWLHLLYLSFALLHLHWPLWC